MKPIKGLATGIGSLPHDDIEAAVDLIFKYTPQVPFWPQLPRLSPCEGMLAQFSEGLPCLALEERILYFDGLRQEEELAKFYEQIINRNLEYFKISPSFAAGLWSFYKRLENTDLKRIEFIKIQVTINKASRE